MAEQSAVGWLVKILYSPICKGFINGNRRIIPHSIIDDAKHKENEQRKQDMKTAYNQGYTDAKCNHINDADNFIHEYLNS
jgi:hypothetical protein